VAFAIYCAGCCGPLLIPLYVFVAASGSLLLGVATSAGFAVAMAIPIALLGVFGQRSLASVGRVVENYDLIRQSAGVALLTLGLLLVLNRPLITVFDAVHRVVGE
jgi:cytochrome c biogenesis protein CcdA